MIVLIKEIVILTMKKNSPQKIFKQIFNSDPKKKTTIKQLSKQDNKWHHFSAEIQKYMRQFQKHMKNFNKQINTQSKKVRDLTTKRINIDELQKAFLNLLEKSYNHYKVRFNQLEQSTKSIKYQVLNYNRQKQQYVKHHHLHSKPSSSPLLQQIQKLQLRIHQNQQKFVEQKQNYQSVIRDKEAVLQKAQRQIQILKKKMEQRISVYNNEKGNCKLFQGDILNKEDDDKEYLVEMLQMINKFKIKATNLLYKFDPLNKTNFHKYIDNKQHIVLIIRSSQDYLFGAYSQPAFSERTVAKGPGLIFSLTSRKVFGLASPNSKAISYDSNSLIFGNNQIRLKHLQDKVFSNFGISNSYYENNGENTYILYGTNQKQQKILAYEIYQLQII